MKKVIISIVCIIVILIILAMIIYASKVINIDKNVDEEKTKTSSENLNEKSNVENDDQKNKDGKQPDSTENSGEKGEDNMNSIKKAEITVKDYGKITVELYPEIAPITVANFEKLVNEGFYNGLTFHRIISGFMIQGGDPKGNGTGGSKEEIKGEFAANGVENNISHTRGTISMARSQNYNSASSQFFIMHKDALYLDKQYAAFGKVLEGMEVVDKICETVQVQDSNGTVLKQDQPVIEKIVMINE